MEAGDAKYKLVKQYSDPHEVFRRGKLLGIEVYLSGRKDKKYCIQNPETHKLVNFGEIGYEDATKHNDPKRIANFHARNAKWKDAPKYSPAYLAYHLLW
jgi:hypothetical protein